MMIRSIPEYQKQFLWCKGFLQESCFEALSEQGFRAPLLFVKFLLTDELRRLRMVESYNGGRIFRRAEMLLNRPYWHL